MLKKKRTRHNQDRTSIVIDRNMNPNTKINSTLHAVLGDNLELMLKVISTLVVR